jgi:hypothetical protein
VVTELPSVVVNYAYFPKAALQKLLALCGIYVIQGYYNLPEDKSLNKLRPDVKTKSIQEILSVWKGK